MLRIRQIRPEIAELVKQNEGYCPCTVEKTPETRCICKAFIEQKEPGECHCGRYVKEVSEC